MESTLEEVAFLRQAGLKATPRRLRLLAVLKREQKPLSVAHLRKELKGFDAVTLYRALEALTAAGALRRVDLRHGHAHYELQEKHHHHLVCSHCGVVEDVEVPSVEKMEKSLLKRSKRFKTISSHDLEFFGLCKKCA